MKYLILTSLFFSTFSFAGCPKSQMQGQLKKIIELDFHGVAVEERPSCLMNKQQYLTTPIHSYYLYGEDSDREIIEVDETSVKILSIGHPNGLAEEMQVNFSVKSRNGRFTYFDTMTIQKMNEGNHCYIPITAPRRNYRARGC